MKKGRHVEDVSWFSDGVAKGLRGWGEFLIAGLKQGIYTWTWFTCGMCLATKPAYKFQIKMGLDLPTLWVL